MLQSFRLQQGNYQPKEGVHASNNGNWVIRTETTKPAFRIISLSRHFRETHHIHLQER